MGNIWDFGNLVKELQPACLVNGRLGGAGDYRSMGDNRIPQTVVPGVWETPATLNDTWGYKSYDDHWKTAADVTFKLVDIVSKGGNCLLNVGPTAEGVIPAESQKCLRAVGQYLKANGEAVYGCDPTPLGDGRHRCPSPNPAAQLRRDYPPSRPLARLLSLVWHLWVSAAGLSVLL